MNYEGKEEETENALNCILKQYLMSWIIQLNCKELRSKHFSEPDTTFLYSICFHEVMFESTKYNLGREYEFYATVHQDKEAIAISKEI